jgi:hypothetical protein
MQTVKPSDLVTLAEAVFTTNRFLFVKGQGGSGKTSILCNQVGPALGRDVWLVNLSGQGPQEVLGYGIPQPNGDMKFAAPTIWPTHDRVGDKPVLLILDELPDYDSEVRALLRGLYPASGSRYVGPHKLGSNVAIAVTGNRKQDGTRSAVEDAPFTERCVSVLLEPSVADWLAYYDSQPHLRSTGSFVPAFLQYGVHHGSDADHFNPPITTPYTGEPHPCPRTWEAVVLAEPYRLSKPHVYHALVVGSVGNDAANAYFGFMQHVDRLPDIKVLQSGGKVDIPDDPAGQFALVNACLATLLRNKNDVGVDVAAGLYDWFVNLLFDVRGDIRMFGALSAYRSGIPLDQHSKAAALLV